jgi:hypothetical protein
VDGLLPGVPHPSVSVPIAADALLLLAIARDWTALRRVHPVYPWAGGVMVACTWSDCWRSPVRRGCGRHAGCCA